MTKLRVKYHIQEGGECQSSLNFITSAKDKSSLEKNLMRINSNEGDTSPRNLFPNHRYRREEGRQVNSEILNERASFGSYVSRLKSLKISKCVPLRIKLDIATK